MSVRAREAKGFPEARNAASAAQGQLANGRPEPATCAAGDRSDMRDADVPERGGFIAERGAGRGIGSMNLTACLRRQSGERPDAPAIVCGATAAGTPDGLVYSYARLDRVVDAIALRASGWDVGPDEFAILDFKTHLPILLLRLGLARAGIPFANSSYPGDPSPSVHLGHDGGPPGRRRIIATPAWWTDASGVPAPMHAGGDVLLKRQATSGTTGRPKRVPITQAMYAARWHRPIGAPLPHNARLLCVSGPGGLGFGYALSVFEAGGTVVLLGPGDDPLGLVDRHRVNVLVASPYAIDTTLRHRPPDAAPPASLEQVVLSGGRLSVELLRLVSRRLCANIIGMYGSTETGPLAAGPVSALPETDGAAGFLLPGAEVQAIDDRGDVLPPGRIGQLRMRTPGLAREYLGDPEATSRAFRDGWFHPNDIGTVTPDGVLVITGRGDDLINVGGSKFAPEVIERVLLRVAGLREAAAFGVPDALGKDTLHAAIVADDDLDAGAILAAFRSTRGIPPPQVVLRVPHLPRGENGKVDRQALVRLAETAGGRPGRPA